MQKWPPLNYSLVFVERSAQTLGATRIDSLIRSQTLKWLNHVARMENFMPQKVEMLFASNQNKNERDRWTKLEQQCGFDKLHLNWGKRWWTSHVFTVGSTTTSSHQLEPIYRPRSNTTALYSQAYRGSVLWNFVNHYVKNVGNIDPKKLRSLLRRNDHFRSFTFTGLSGSAVRNRLTNYTYFWVEM